MSDPYRTESKPVSVAAVKEELKALWASEAIDGEAVIRARTHNLIVYAPASLYSVDEITEQVISLTGARPGRVIVIYDDWEGESKLEAWVNIYCGVQGQHQVCGESIVLSTGGKQRDELHSTVVSLLATDLPVSLWWMTEPPDNDHLFNELVGEIDRLIVDSDAFENQIDGLMRLDQFEDAPSGDLAWERLLPWRRHLAQVWDAAENRESLRHIRTVDVMVNTAGDFMNVARALLLCGWLADRLGWKLESAAKGPTGGYTTIWQHNSWQGKVEIVESSFSALPLGEIACIFIQAGSRPPYILPRIELSLDGGCVDLRFNDASPSALRRRIDYRPVSTAAALARLLEQPSDPVYRGALNNVGKILEMAKS
ncbi:MAG: glucose-6-phosphate dehydrogenase assembly protein OpcA [Anaerolineae bacterium]|nr:glucose-6-phosphate dehydrogenase assembly protein OpcA [Anaerolineae bacterium]